MSQKVPLFRVMYKCSFCGAIFEVHTLGFENTADREASKIATQKPYVIHDCEEGVAGIAWLAYVQLKVESDTP